MCLSSDKKSILIVVNNQIYFAIGLDLLKIERRNTWIQYQLVVFLNTIENIYERNNIQSKIQILKHPGMHSFLLV